MALHIPPSQSPDQINQTIKGFFDTESNPDISWTIDFIVRKSSPESHRGADSISHNQQNIDNLAYLEERFPDIFDRINIVYVEVADFVDTFGWSPKDHFFKIVPPTKS